MSTQMDVILPEATSGQIGMEGERFNKKYKTLYLLHGMSDDQTIWQRRTSIERYVAPLGIAVVMPTTHLGWYTNMFNGLDYFTYISEELPSICRAFFPNMSDRREDNYIAGLSMGGYGALKTALSRPERFCAAASLSGGLDVADTVKNRGDGKGSYWADIFGPADGVTGSENDLYTVSSRLAASGHARPRLYMWCGTGDFLYNQNIRMRDHLSGLGYELTYKDSPGDHQWKYWDDRIQDVLNWAFGEGVAE